MSKLYGTEYVCIAVLAAVLIFAANAANYDGRWVGQAPPVGAGDCGTLSVVMNVNGKPTARASPWQNGVAERLIGSVRRECLDHIIVLGETHLRRILKSYADYYNPVS